MAQTALKWLGWMSLPNWQGEQTAIYECFEREKLLKLTLILVVNQVIIAEALSNVLVPGEAQIDQNEVWCYS